MTEESMSLKAIMYHYVRPDREDLPNFRHLHVEDFCRQLDYFEATSGFADRDAFIAAFSGEEMPDGVILTFDDGFADHHDYVLHELEARRLWGIFYIPTAPLDSGEMLSVHRIHMLLGRHPASEVARKLKELLEEGMIEDDKREEFQERTYMWQQNPDDVLYVKRTLNYFLNPVWRKPLLDSMMKHFFGGEEMELARELYMTPDQIRALHVLEENGCLFSFNVEPRDMTTQDILSRPQALPRYDCNMFPHGQCRTPA